MHRTGRRYLSIVVSLASICGAMFLVEPASAAISSTERDALVALYDGTGGGQWVRRDAWKGAVGTECTWFGVTCSAGGTTVTRLELKNNNLTGPIPSAVGQLPSLQILDLSGNSLTGDVPKEVWRMASLAELWLEGNKLTGPIPADVGSLVNLERLKLFYNTFSGGLPVELTQLPKLREIDVSYNTLSGSIPTELGRMTQLEVLNLSLNSFSGTIPAGIGDLPKLTTLDLGVNQLTGVPPASLGKLTNLKRLGLHNNHFSGPIPPWIANMTALQSLFVSSNDFTGSVPDFFWQLPNLEALSFGTNALTGSISPQIRNLKKLFFFDCQYTAMSGPLPREIGELRSMQYLYISGAGLTGQLPVEIGNFSELLYLFAYDNEFEGPIPAEIGNLKKLQWLDLSMNHLSGAIPPQIGNLTAMTALSLNANALRGPIPREITNLTALREPGGLNLQENALSTSDPDVLAFLARKTIFGDNRYQTIPPNGLKVVSVTDRSATLSWDALDLYGLGAYQVVARTAPGGAATSVAMTPTLNETQIVIRNLAPQTTYYFTVSSLTFPWWMQKNMLVSDPSAAVTATTGPRVAAPADVQLTERPTGLIQVDGVPRNEDHFTLTNVGDQPSSVALTSFAPFATFDPARFTLQPGASQTVTIKSIPQQAAGMSFGYVNVDGDGAKLQILVQLLSVAKTTGTVKAEAVDSRVDVAGEPGSDSIGSVRFRNVGSATLTGMLVSDQPWVVQEGQTIAPVVIPAGGVISVNFRVVRSLRPAGAEGALTANLSLVYAEGTQPVTALAAFGAGTPGISITTVTVVDVSRPAVSSGPIPPASGVAYFLPGLASMLRGGSSFLSDVSFVNQSGSGAIGDLRLYYTAAASQETKIAALSPIGASQSVTLSNVVTAVYGASSQVGSIQVRSNDPQNLGVLAKLIGSGSAGTLLGDVPAFRSDRSATVSDAIYLAGVAKSSSRHSDLYVQETKGAAASVRIDFLDPNGGSVGSKSASVAPWGLVEMLDAVPAGAVTAVVSNTGTTGEIAAYARLFDDTTGDSWSIVDWSRTEGFKLGERLRVPFIDGGSAPSAGGPRRRAARTSTSAPAGTDVTLFNPSSDKAVAIMRISDANGTSSDREIVVNARQTVTITNVGSSLGTSTAQLVILPRNDGQIVASARSSSRSVGSAVPVIPAGTGLRTGQSHIFSGLEDSTATTVAAGRPGTYRTSFGITETGGGTAVVRARIALDEGRGVATAVIYRDFQLAAGQQVLVDEVVRAIVGSTRDERLGELHNLQLRVEMVSGSGAVVPFVIITDNGTGDSLLRLE